jgi:hypothetical protein
MKQKWLEIWRDLETALGRLNRFLTKLETGGKT